MGLRSSGLAIDVCVTVAWVVRRSVHDRLWTRR